MAMVFSLCACFDKETTPDIASKHLKAILTTNSSGIIDDEIYKEYRLYIKEEFEDEGIEEYPLEDRKSRINQYIPYINNGGIPDFDFVSENKEKAVYKVWISPSSLYRDYMGLGYVRINDYDENQKMIENLYYGECVPIKVVFEKTDDGYKFTSDSIKKIIKTWINVEQKGI